MKLTLLVLLFAIAPFAVGEPPLPQLSTADKIALQTEEKVKQDASTQYQNAQQTELTILGEFTKLHPGFHVDTQTFVVSADPKPDPKPAAKVVERPAEKPAAAPVKK